MAMSRSREDSVLTTRSPIVQGAAADVLQPGDHPQGGGLAAAGRTDEHDELAVGDVDGEVVYGVEAVLVLLVDLVEDYFGHDLLIPSRRRR